MSAYTDEKSLVFGLIKNKKGVKEDTVINFLQNELHGLTYSYINGGFSKKGFSVEGCH